MYEEYIYTAILVMRAEWSQTTLVVRHVEDDVKEAAQKSAKHSHTQTQYNPP